VALVPVISKRTREQLDCMARSSSLARFASFIEQACPRRSFYDFIPVIVIPSMK
jgi:hypothetical protein